MEGEVTKTKTERQKQTLKAYAHTLGRETHVLTLHPDLLWQQMYNRLQWEGEEVNQNSCARTNAAQCTGCQAVAQGAISLP